MIKIEHVFNLVLWFGFVAEMSRHLAKSLNASKNSL